MSEALAERAAERERLIATARSYVRTLSSRLTVRAAWLAGSVARGDFNVWSDVDVVLVAEDLPPRAPERSALLAADAPARVQPVGYTPVELEEAKRRGNPLVLEAIERGISLLGPE